MQFQIARVGEKHTPPCDEAVEHEFIQVDSYEENDPHKLPSEYVRQDWDKRGVNHRVEDGQIKRDIPANGWFIELTNLEDLCEFVKKHGKINVSLSPLNPQIIRLEIIDDKSKVNN